MSTKSYAPELKKVLYGIRVSTFIVYKNFTEIVKEKRFVLGKINKNWSKI